MGSQSHADQANGWWDTGSFGRVSWATPRRRRVRRERERARANLPRPLKGGEAAVRPLPCPSKGGLAAASPLSIAGGRAGMDTFRGHTEGATTRTVPWRPEGSGRVTTTPAHQAIDGRGIPTAWARERTGNKPPLCGGSRKTWAAVVGAHWTTVTV